MSQCSDINEKIVSALLSLKKFLPHKQYRMIDSSTVTTNAIKSNDSFSFSDLQPYSQLKNHELDDSPYCALEILSQVELILQKNKKRDWLMYNCLDHMFNFMENFQLIGYELHSVSSILLKSYKYSLEHLTSTVSCLNEYPIEFEFELNKKWKQNLKEIDKSITQMQKKIEKIEEHKPRVFEGDQKRLGEEKALKMEIKGLRKKVQEYEEERQTFIKIHQYYDQQLNQYDRGRNNESLPTFNYQTEYKEKEMKSGQKRNHYSVRKKYQNCDYDYPYY